MLTDMLACKKLFLFDIDGTLAVGNALLPGAEALLHYIASIGGKSYFITNNSTRSALDYVNRFSVVFGLATTEQQFITSGSMAVRFLTSHFAGRRIFVLGTASFIDELQRNALVVTTVAQPDVACVLAAYDSELTYRKLVETCRVLSTTDAPFYATNPDLCCPVDFGFVPDCGAICQMLTHSTGKTPVYLGKPSAEVVALCLQDSGFAPEQTLVVGDRLYTDIACGQNAGVDTCAVLTGEASPQELAHTPYTPDYTFPSVKELLAALRGSV